MVKEPPKKKKKEKAEKKQIQCQHFKHQINTISEISLKDFNLSNHSKGVMGKFTFALQLDEVNCGERAFCTFPHPLHHQREDQGWCLWHLTPFPARAPGASLAQQNIDTRKGDVAACKGTKSRAKPGGAAEACCWEQAGRMGTGGAELFGSWKLIPQAVLQQSHTHT